jgi:hypothetical protein
MCGSYEPLGFWYRLHLRSIHKMSDFRASRFMVRQCSDESFKPDDLKAVQRVQELPREKKMQLVQTVLFNCYGMDISKEIKNGYSRV